jgi:hypothetical protein
MCSSVEGVLGPLLCASILDGPLGWQVPVEAVAVRRRGWGLLELLSSCWTLRSTAHRSRMREQDTAAAICQIGSRSVTARC